MGKTVWIMNHYASHMLFDKGGRHYYFAKYLDRAGYAPIVFCANVQNTKTDERYIETDKLWTVKEAEEIHTPFVFVKARAYKGNGIQRILNMVDFYKNVKMAARKYAQLHEKPEIILASSVHPLTLLAGIQLARHYGVKCICEVRDLWPESLVVYGIMGAKNPIIIAMRILEKWIYKNADALIFTAEGMYDYIRKQGWEKAIPREKAHYINNGVDLETFDYNREHYTVEDEDLENDELFKIVYAGSIRRVNALGLLLDVAKLIKNEKIRLLIWGNGNELESLRQRVIDENITNTVFKGKVEKCYVPYITSAADLNITHNTPSPIFQYGISFNKVFDYLAAGKPILCDFPANYNPVIELNAGYEVESGVAPDIARVIDEISTADEAVLQKYACNARIGAAEYTFENLTKKLITLIESLIE